MTRRTLEVPRGARNPESAHVSVRWNFETKKKFATAIKKNSSTHSNSKDYIHTYLYREGFCNCSFASKSNRSLLSLHQHCRERKREMWMFYLISLPLTTGMVILTLRYFAGPDVPRYVFFTVGYTWFCSISIIVLVPADIWTVTFSFYSLKLFCFCYLKFWNSV